MHSPGTYSGFWSRFSDTPGNSWSYCHFPGNLRSWKARTSAWWCCNNSAQFLLCRDPRPLEGDTRLKTAEDNNANSSSCSMKPSRKRTMRACLTFGGQRQHVAKRGKERKSSQCVKPHGESLFRLCGTCPNYIQFYTHKFPPYKPWGAGTNDSFHSLFYKKFSRRHCVKGRFNETTEVTAEITR